MTPPFKENPGNGPQLPGAGIAAIAPPPLAVGAQPAIPPFPVNLAALNNLTHQNISDLAVIYNDDFGIVAADLIAARQVKFLHWLQGYQVISTKNEKVGKI